MAEQGKITISVGVDSGQAIDGLKDLQDGLKDMGDTSGKAGAKVVDSFEDIDKAAKDSAKAVDKSSTTAQKAMKDTAKVAQQSGKQTKDALDQVDTIQGLEGLKDTTGELDSSLKGLGGAVGLVSPNMERLLFVTGELSGGIEASARLSMLFKGSLSGIVGPLSLVAVGAVAAGAAIFSLSQDARRATIDSEALEGALAALDSANKRVAKTRLELRVESGELSQLEAQLETVADTVREDFAQELEDAKAPFAGFRENAVAAHQALQDVRTQLDLAASGSIPGGAAAVRDLTERENRLSQAFREQVGALEEAIDGSTQEATTRRAVMATVEEEIALRTQLLESRIAAERERKAADAAREARARREKARAEREAAQREAERKREEERRKAEEAAMKLQDARIRGADMLAEARGAEAQVEREYAKAIMEVNALRVQGAITEEEMTELVLAAFQKRSEAIDELKAKQVDLNETTKLSLTDYGKAITAVQDLTGNALAAMAEDIDRREAEALATAEGNLEKQAEIKAQFDQERAGEMSRVFKANQATAIAGAVISGAQAAAAALAPPPTGFGPNLGLAMIPILAANTAAQVAMIAQQKPSFHQGGMIGGQGDQMITAQGGEAVLNRAAVASLGGESGVDSLNAGGAGGGAVVVQMVYKQRVLDELIVDNLAKGGPLKRAINDSSRRARRGRIGGRL